MSLHSYIYLFFQHYISKYTDIKNIDLFFNQVSDESNGKMQPIKYPKCLIEILPFELNSYLGMDYQEADCTVKVHLYIELIEGTAYGDKRQSKTLDLLSKLDTLYMALAFKTSGGLPEELSSDIFNISNVIPSNIEFASDSGNIKEIIMSYNFKYSFNLLTELDETIDGVINFDNIIVTINNSL